MDARYITPFLISTRRVFETMVHTSVTICKPEVRNDSCGAADVSGIIGMSGDVTGCVVLALESDVACRVASAFAGHAIDSSSPDFADAIGELANMVAGNAKTEMHGLNVSISLPSVIIGAHHTICQMRALPRIVIPCQTTLGPLFIDVGLRLEKPAARPSTAAGATR